MAQQWETKSVFYNPTKDSTAAICNQQGAEGWEPWFVRTGLGGSTIYFKRPKEAALNP